MMLSCLVVAPFGPVCPVCPLLVPFLLFPLSLSLSSSLTPYLLHPLPYRIFVQIIYPRAFYLPLPELYRVYKLLLYLSSPFPPVFLQTSTIVLDQDER